MNHNWMGPSLLMGILCAAIPQARAHDLPAALAACKAEKDDARRLGCYDREIAAPDPQSSSAGTAPMAAAPVPAAPVATAQTAEERFGYRGVMAREEHDQAKADARSLGQLEATVTAISNRGDGALVMTLDNDQVWAQNRPDAFFRLKVGEKVKIEPASLGSFLMISPAKRTARVTRLR